MTAPCSNRNVSRFRRRDTSAGTACNMQVIRVISVLVIVMYSNADLINPDTANGTESLKSDPASEMQIPAPRVINGFDVEKSPFQAPWIVVLLYRRQILCSGSLINSQHILTLARCVVHRPKDPNGKPNCAKPFESRSKDIQAVIGETDIAKVQHIHSKFHDIFHYWVHDKYEENACGGITNDYDFAILRIWRPVSNTPICLYSGDTVPGTEAFIFGYGSTDPSKDAPVSLRPKAAKLYQIPPEECSKSWGYKIPRSQLCFVPPIHFKNDGSKPLEVVANLTLTGPCKGDSGGPLAAYDRRSSSFLQIGVTVGGFHNDVYDCTGQAPYIYGSVSAALPFIRSKAGFVKIC